MHLSPTSKLGYLSFNSLIILTPTGDRNGSHVRSAIDIDLFMFSGY